MNTSVFVLSALIAGSCWARVKRTFDAWCSRLSPTSCRRHGVPTTWC